MPIHDQGYRRYLGSKAAVGKSWQVIARAGIRTVLSKRSFIALMLLAWAPFLVRAVQVYIAANFQQASFLAPRAETFREFLEQQGVFVFFVTIYVGAGLIANDRRANALQVYLSKPLTRAEYVAGKFAILFLFLASVTWLPAILLLLVQTMFAGNFAFVQENVFLLPAITLFSLLQVLVSAMTMLALSSMSKSSRFVGIMYAGLIFFTAAFFQALRGITGRSSWAWLSPTDTLEQIGAYIFRIDPPYQLSPLVAIATIVVLIAGSAWILERNVRGVEVVK
ncbi:MAG TPA: ABC transporter permease subunit [Vicinamibacterales bacterium]|nr:ABC transporter permease subunit [Vicinamibacterales bacterium]